MTTKELLWFLLYLVVMSFSIFMLVMTWGATNWVTGGFDKIAIGWIIGLNVILAVIIIIKRKKKQRYE